MPERSERPQGTSQLHAFDRDWTVAPAAFLIDWMKASEGRITVASLQHRIGGQFPPEMIRAVLDRKPLTAQHAEALDLATGYPRSTWLAREHLYRADLADGRKDATPPMPRQLDPDRPCPHEDFQIDAEITPLATEEGGPVTGYAAALKVRCAQCDEPFRWMGLPAGISGRKPMVSADETELRAPIRPASSDPDFGLAIPGYAIHMNDEPRTITGETVTETGPESGLIRWTWGWVHEDGTECAEFLAPPDAGHRLWCTIHQQHISHRRGEQAGEATP